MTQPPFETPPDQPTRDDLPGQLTIIDAIGDSSYRHECGAMVTQTFHSETPAVCSHCGRTT